MRPLCVRSLRLTQEYHRRAAVILSDGKEPSQPRLEAGCLRQCLDAAASREFRKFLKTRGCSLLIRFSRQMAAVGIAVLTVLESSRYNTVVYDLVVWMLARVAALIWRPIYFEAPEWFFSHFEHLGKCCHTLTIARSTWIFDKIFSIMGSLELFKMKIKQADVGTITGIDSAPIGYPVFC